ncbi:MAG: helix-turn-helix domain-containing protein [Acetobacter fabarum]|jgi:hypothetical protein|uniref:helix-turn-helix domain-containing protein n=1 Tax=Acetobacter TaxID=434 RepID=UPI00131EF19A|nr:MULTISPECIES: helix-turn-helix domain-containing protein [Acetobacter]MCH4025763.1 helix-turn-helix domain-containing protein [Acetobacter fabarum]MCH4054584.1 helix-turn-helix domain-containing protein [Acetobacter fabarum]MCH4086377.1 helix-turn-helix domain-containing protein [Acetobacter fabarum]MCH4128843.1 helix-turn-helix domain-containing protein [Acetobacter fabarum]MCH4138252.1 helix-turn-helix domain-containing protein [Acetobacter fabarum]
MKMFYFTERDAAAHLGISVSTLRRERLDGRIGYLKIRFRVRYTQTHISDYLLRNEQCPTISSELGNTFLENAPTRMHGARAGMNHIPDRQSEHLLAQQFFRKPK